MRAATLGLFAAVVLVPTGLADDAKDDAKAIQGTWEAVEFMIGGVKAPEDTLKIHELTLKDGKYERKNSAVPDKGTYKLNPDKKPKEIDLVDKDVTFQGIYELEGDRLKICYDAAEEKRPAELQSKKGTTLLLVTYKRAK